MIKRSLIVLILSLQISNIIFAQDSLIIVGDAYKNSFSSPLLFLKGNQLSIEIDSVYLINTKRMRFYKNLHQEVKSGQCADLLDFTVKRYERLLTTSDEQYLRLQENCNKSNLLTQDLIQTTKTSLQQTDRTLELTQVSLQSATDNLSEASELLKRERKKTFMDKLLIGAGGVGLGLLIGLLVAN